MPASATQQKRQRGERALPRQGARPRALPGTAKGDPRQDPEFLTWLNRWGVYGQSTYPEYLIFRWLEQHGLKAGLDFQYLGHAPSAFVRGSQQVDFLVYSYLAWAVNGIYWHFIRDPYQRIVDAINRASLEDQGYIVVEMLDLDVVERTDLTIRNGLNGIELPGAREGRAAE